MPNLQSDARQTQRARSENVGISIFRCACGLVAAIRKSFSGASWQRCKVHVMRNILAHIPQTGKDAFAKELKEIWFAPAAAGARERAAALCEKYATHYPKAIETLENGMGDSLTFYVFPQLDHRKIASTNMRERLNEEIRRRIRVVGIFPYSDSYVHLVTTYLMEYSEDWPVSISGFAKLLFSEGCTSLFCDHGHNLTRSSDKTTGRSRIFTFIRNLLMDTMISIAREGAKHNFTRKRFSHISSCTCILSEK